jgi:hypothetical protein
VTFVTQTKNARQKRKQVPHPDRAVPPQLAEGLPLFVLILAVDVAVILLFQLARQGSTDEVWDKGIFLTAGLLGVGWTVWAALGKKLPQGAVLAAAFIATGGLAVGVGALEGHVGYEEMYPDLWAGWGPWALLLALVASPLVWRIVHWHTLPRSVRVALSVAVGLVCAADLLSIWQTRTSLIDPFSAEYVVNEMLAPAAGHVPYSDFVPQYQSLLAWMVWPFARVATPNQLIEITVGGLSLLGVIAVALGVWLAHKALGKRSLTLAALLVVPLTCVVPFPIRDDFLGSIASQLSGLPIRICLGVVLAALVIPVLQRMSAGSVSTRRLVAIGAWGGFYLWNSQDFGLAGVVTTFFLVLMAPNVAGGTRLRVLFTTSAALGAALLAYPLITAALGRPVDTTTLAFFLRQFGGGFGAEAIQVPGPVLVIVPMILATALVSLYFVWTLREAPRTPAFEQARHAAFTGAFFGCWATLGLSYYLNRSFASGQMQVLFLPVAVAFAGLLGVVLSLEEEVPAFGSLAKGWGEVRERAAARRFVSNYPVTLLASLLLASVLLTPSPSYEKTRLSGQTGGTRALPTSYFEPTIQDVAAAKAYADSLGQSLAYYGQLSNYVELGSGLGSVNLFNNPLDLTTGRRAIELGCDHIVRLDPDLLVLSDLGRGLFTFRGNTLCGRYEISTAPGVRDGYFAKRIEP